MSKSMIVICQNNGVRAVMLLKDYEILKQCESNEDALAKGVRWYVFMTFSRMSRNPENFHGASIGSYEDYMMVKDRTVRYESRDVSFYVPFSNGPAYYKNELKFVFPLTDLLYRLAYEG